MLMEVGSTGKLVVLAPYMKEHIAESHEFYITPEKKLYIVQHNVVWVAHAVLYVDNPQIKYWEH